MKMKLSRRFFIRSSGIALVGFGAVPGFLRRAAASVPDPATRGKTLVVIFQRGAMDGLNAVIPHGDRNYYKLRSSIAVPRPSRGKRQTVIDLDGFFGLHPSLSPLKPLYDEGLLAVVHAAGSPDATRSHFDAQDFMESGTPGRKGTEDGWLNRYLQRNSLRDATSFRAVSATGQLPRILLGKAGALAIPSLEEFGFRANRRNEVLQRGFEKLYQASPDDPLSATVRETFEALEFIEQTDPAQHKPANGASYPRTIYGRNLLQIAQLIKSGAGLEIAFVELGGWDHHVAEGGSTGQLANLLRHFSRGLAAFRGDLGDRMEDVVVLTLSEFGRTAAENGNRGTDHGHATCLFALGGSIDGGKVYGDWPGLAPEQLYEGRDLALTTDFRDVAGEILERHLGAVNMKEVFPGYALDPARFRKLVKFRAA